MLTKCAKTPTFPLFISHIPNQILTDARVVTKDSPFTGSFYIDTTVGKETSLTFSYSRDVTVKVQGPSSEYTARSHPASFRDDKGSHVLKVMLPGDADVSVGVCVCVTVCLCECLYV